MSKNLGSSLGKGFLVFLSHLKYRLLKVVKYMFDVSTTYTEKRFSYKYLEKTLLWFCKLQVHLSSLNNLELCKKPFFEMIIFLNHGMPIMMFTKNNTNLMLPNTQNAFHAPLVYYREVSTACWRELAWTLTKTTNTEMSQNPFS